MPKKNRYLTPYQRFWTKQKRMVYHIVVQDHLEYIRMVMNIKESIALMQIQHRPHLKNLSDIIFLVNFAGIVDSSAI
jgi:hypothetical protein